jgi:pyruvate kinase
MAKEILCTLGPASLDPRIIGRLEQGGATLFRINLSHTKVRDLPRLIETIRSATEIPICLDTEGAQIRTGDLVNGDITMRDNTIVRAHARRVPGDDKNFSLYPAGITEQLEVGDFISIDFNSVLVQVIGIEKDFVSMRVLHGGRGTRQRWSWVVSSGCGTSPFRSRTSEATSRRSAAMSARMRS